MKNINKLIIPNKNDKYNEEIENILILSETLKGFENLDSLAFFLEMDIEFKSYDFEVNDANFISKKIINIIKNDNPYFTREELIEKHINLLKININSLFKLGLSNQEILNNLKLKKN